MNGSKISSKKINTHLQEVSEEEQLIKLRIEQLNQELQKKQQIKDKLKKKKKKLDNKALEVSEHALLRFFERIEGRDVEAIRQQIMDPSIKELIKVLSKNGTYPHPDGYSVVVRNNNVVTVTK